MLPVNKIKKTSLVVIGLCSLLLGFIGLFLPLLPTTPFVLLSAWCFARSSPRFYQWLISHAVFGEPLKSWQKNRSISVRSKVLAGSMIIFSMLVIWLKVDFLEVRLGTSLFLICVFVFIVSRPSSA